MSPARVHLSRFWSTDRSLTVFLILLLVIVFVLHPLGDLGFLNRLWIGLVFSFLLVSGVAAVAAALQPKLVYFSFVTLTTTGYGDFTPVNPVARALSNLESLVGQLYPVVLIARLVAMELQFRDK